MTTVIIMTIADTTTILMRMCMWMLTMTTITNNGPRTNQKEFKWD
jgi:hypothetical protein